MTVIHQVGWDSVFYFITICIYLFIWIQCFNELPGDPGS